MKRGSVEFRYHTAKTTGTPTHQNITGVPPERQLPTPSPSTNHHKYLAPDHTLTTIPSTHQPTTDHAPHSPRTLPHIPPPDPLRPRRRRQPHHNQTLLQTNHPLHTPLHHAHPIRLPHRPRRRREHASYDLFPKHRCREREKDIQFR